MKISKTALLYSLSASAVALMIAGAPAMAQDKKDSGEVVIITGSSIKRKALDSALPLQVLTKEEIQKEGISSAEQLAMFLASNGTSTDNLASNTDVSPTGTPYRGFNGASTVNLRGQGAGATLVLLNGRRLASHGLKGTAVDINQIPMAAIERIDVLKDGASAIYGTDAVGGVVNFITKKSYEGLNLQAFGDFTEAGGGNIYRTTILGGWGDLAEQKFNIWATASYSKNDKLMATQRDFIKTYQPDRGMSTDTRGTPFATITSVAGTFLNSGNVPVIPGSPTGQKATGGINPLDLPGNLGCNAIARMNKFEDVLWQAPQNALVCEFDTGLSAALQQPIEKANFVTRATLLLGDATISAEAMATRSIANKIYSEVQVTSGVSFPAYYPRNALTQTVWDRVYNQLITAFPSLTLSSLTNAPPFALRWRCMECGPREVETTTDVNRFFVGIDGQMASEWNYRLGTSYASSQSDSVHKSGFYYQRTDPTLGIVGLADLIANGTINPFLLPGEKQTDAAMAALKSASAAGLGIYGGKFEIKQVDGSVSGPLFDIWGGKIYAALGFDIRNESYSMRAEPLAAALIPYSSPINDNLVLNKVERDSNALFGEVMLPIIPKMELTIAGRYDTYDGFGSVFNPKYSVKYKPLDNLMFRGSYGTGFIVPTFDRLWSTQNTQPYGGNDIVDPAKCPSGVVNTSDPNCAPVLGLAVRAGGNPNLGPEESEQYSFGVVYEPTPKISLALDWWKIERTGTVQTLSMAQLIANYNLFADRFERDQSGKITAINRSWINAGGTLTEGVDVNLRARGDIFDGKWSAVLDGTYLLDKKSRLLPSVPWGASEVGQYYRFADLGLKWKHNLNFTFTKGDWSGSLSQIFRSSYKDQVLPGVKNGNFTGATNLQEDVDAYIIYNASVTYKGFKNFTITGGIKNLLDTDPPFAIAYDTDTGSGSSWEPRVADPRGRSFTILLDYKF